MAPDTTSVRIVRTIPGQSTGGDDDVYITEDGRAWKRVSDIEVNSTCSAPRAKLRNGRIER